MSNDNSMQKRAIIATLLAFIFFIGYDYFYLSKFRSAEANATIIQDEINAPAKKVSTPDSSAIKTISPANDKQTLLTLESEFFKASIDELGRINSFELSDEIYVDDSGKALNLVDKSLSPLPLEIRFTNEALNQKAFETPYTTTSTHLDLKSGEKSVVLTQDLGELVVTKRLNFSKNGSYSLEVNLSKDESFYITPGSRPNVIADGYTVHGVLLRESGGSLEVLKDGKVSKGSESFENIDIISAFDRYYASLFYNFEAPMSVIVGEDAKGEVNQAFILASSGFKASGFMGPKHKGLLTSINPELKDVIEYGFFTFISKPMFSFLSYLYAYTHNWGWAIVLMTIFIRILLFPLTYKGMVSMNKIKDLAPKMKEIQEKYKDDKQKMQMHVMELYKKHGANPMGGCLPILLQIPVFFAVYRVLLNAIELQGAQWILWIENLAIKDPYFILPALMGISMFIQQRLTPTTFTDPMQEKIMKFLPLIFVFFFATFPAGLTLYWCTNNILSVIQQLIVNRIFKKQKMEKTESK